MKIFASFIIVFFLYASCTIEQNLTSHSDTKYLQKHLTAITQSGCYRNYQDLNCLNKTAAYIHKTLANYCDTVKYQPFYVGTAEYKNVIGSLGTENERRIIVGAHYDVAGNQQGADDNASGVTGLLELARILEKMKLNYRIDLVAYTLEEPPFFRSEYMGSYVHAKSLKEKNIETLGMVCLEMIGYFNEEAGSQDYPLPQKTLIYGNEGDYIMIVQKMNAGAFTNQFRKNMKDAELIETHHIKAPSKVPGIDFSDHMNYWEFDYDALMVTNTAYHRNKNYHTQGDVLDSLDLERMSKVIDEVAFALARME